MRKGVGSMKEMDVEQKKWFLKGVKHSLSLVKNMKQRKINTLDACISALKQEVQFCNRDISDAEDMLLHDTKMTGGYK